MKNVIYDINTNILDNNILKQYIFKFFENRIRENPNKLYFVILKLRAKDTTSYKSLHKGLIINSTSFNNYIKYINNQLSLKSNYYTETVMDQIIFEYFEVPNNKLNYFKNKLVNFIDINIPNDIKFYDFSNSTITLKIPLNRNYESWVNILEGQYFFKDINNKIIFKYFLKGKLLLDFMDYDYNNKYFIREFDNQKYYIHKDNQSIDLITKEMETKYLNKVNRAKKSKNKIITFDIETILKDNIHIPYLYSMYDGTNKYSWFTNSPENLFKELLQSKYYGYSVYAHNLSRFDIIFIFKYISTLKNKYQITPIIKDGNIISLTIEKGKLIKITFKDSYLMLPSSLSKLAKQFKVDNKGIFPYKFINIIPLNYNGNVPDYNYFSNLSIEEYNNYNKSFSNNIWSLRDETIKYCEQDCKSLYQIINKFSKLIFKLFRINILKYPTLSSLAFAIYRSKFLGDAKIPLITGQIYDDLKLGYKFKIISGYLFDQGFIFENYVNELYEIKIT
uniref:Probable DNA polymerase n=1 Tax=Chroogomphus rutilus TaxID=85976 RepID=A0A8F0HYT4_9AGAM|nr:DNA polymerase [Chroogomphus rutilus]